MPRLVTLASYDISVIIIMILIIFKSIEGVKFVVDNILRIIIVVAVHHDPRVLPRLESSECTNRPTGLRRSISSMLCVILLELAIGVL